MRCKAGDIAIVVNAVNKSNIGNVVTVIKPYDGKYPLPGEGHQWLIQCSVPLLWCNPDDSASPRYRRTKGPVFDSQLQPIRPPGGRYGVDAMDKADIPKHDVQEEIACLDHFG